ncbi:hypothetical protein F5Y12DRAFT_769077 [Xylaria sp. FL1777]|nr:hypothetical protein F5Y12DRAFT_769077 [Xylaria sp. FL1777]
MPGSMESNSPHGREAEPPQLPPRQDREGSQDRSPEARNNDQRQNDTAVSGNSAAVDNEIPETYRILKRLRNRMSADDIRRLARVSPSSRSWPRRPTPEQGSNSCLATGTPLLIDSTMTDHDHIDNSVHGAHDNHLSNVDLGQAGISGIREKKRRTKSITFCDNVTVWEDYDKYDDDEDKIENNIAGDLAPFGQGRRSQSPRDGTPPPSLESLLEFHHANHVPPHKQQQSQIQPDQGLTIDQQEAVRQQPDHNQQREMQEISSNRYSTQPPLFLPHPAPESHPHHQLQPRITTPITTTTMTPTAELPPPAQQVTAEPSPAKEPFPPVWRLHTLLRTMITTPIASARLIWSMIVYIFVMVLRHLLPSLHTLMAVILPWCIVLKFTPLSLLTTLLRIVVTLLNWTLLAYDGESRGKQQAEMLDYSVLCGVPEPTSSLASQAIVHVRLYEQFLDKKMDTADKSEGEREQGYDPFVLLDGLSTLGLSIVSELDRQWTTTGDDHTDYYTDDYFNNREERILRFVELYEELEAQAKQEENNAPVTIPLEPQPQSFPPLSIQQLTEERRTQQALFLHLLLPHVTLQAHSGTLLPKNPLFQDHATLSTIAHDIDTKLSSIRHSLINASQTLDTARRDVAAEVRLATERLAPLLRRYTCDAGCLWDAGAGLGSCTRCIWGNWVGRVVKRAAWGWGWLQSCSGVLGDEKDDGMRDCNNGHLMHAHPYLLILQHTRHLNSILKMYNSVVKTQVDELKPLIQEGGEVMQLKNVFNKSHKKMNEWCQGYKDQRGSKEQKYQEVGKRSGVNGDEEKGIPRWEQDKRTLLSIDMLQEDLRAMLCFPFSPFFSDSPLQQQHPPRDPPNRHRGDGTGSQETHDTDTSAEEAETAAGSNGDGSNYDAAAKRFTLDSLDQDALARFKASWQTLMAASSLGDRLYINGTGDQSDAWFQSLLRFAASSSSLSSSSARYKKQNIRASPTDRADTRRSPPNLASGSTAQRRRNGSSNRSDSSNKNKNEGKTRRPSPDLDEAQLLHSLIQAMGEIEKAALSHFSFRQYHGRNSTSTRGSLLNYVLDLGHAYYVRGVGYAHALGDVLAVVWAGDDEALAQLRLLRDLADVAAILV